MFGNKILFCFSMFKNAKKFRKGLRGTSFKYIKIEKDKRNPHAVDAQTRAKLTGTNNQKIIKLKKLIRNSQTPFGYFYKGRFIYQKQKYPQYRIPQIDSQVTTNNKLKPYVSKKAIHQQINKQ